MEIDLRMAVVAILSCAESLRRGREGDADDPSCQLQSDAGAVSLVRSNVRSHGGQLGGGHEFTR